MDLQDAARADFMNELNQIAGTSLRMDTSIARVLWSAIETETDEPKRQALIREYLSTIDQLDEKERVERRAALNARYGRPADAASPARP